MGWSIRSLGVAAVVLAAAQALAAAPRPNIVFIMADDLGYAHLGCYGQQKIATPSLDRMAAQGMRFTDVYAGCCVCAPSRAVLMTGLHGGHAPVRGNSGGIPIAPEDVTVAEVLQEAGYATGLCGKWGLGEHGTTGVPNLQGFDEFFGYLHQLHAHFYYPDYLWLNDERYPLPGNQGGQRGQYTHDEIVARALDFVDRHAAQASPDDRPFFLYVPFAVPHYELLVPEDSLEQYAGKFDETPYRGRRAKTGYPHDYAAQDMPRAATAAIISHLDRSVGKLLAKLAERGLDEQTIVFFTSDNGATPGPSDPEFFQACGPLRGTKGTLYEGGIRVPMIVRWPGHMPPDTVSRQAWSFADVMPTLAELAGAKPPPGIDGISMLPTLVGAGVVGRQQQDHAFYYWEDGPDRAMRSGNYKAIRNGAKGSVELYDLASDVGEQHDIAAKHPDVVARLTRLLDGQHVDPRPQIEPEPPANLDRKFQ